MLPVNEIDSPAFAFTSAMLRELSFPVHRFGYDHMIVAVTRYAKGDMQSLTKELYPYVADYFGYSDWHAIEHSLRSVITDTWEVRNPQVWEQYFPHLRKAPSNKRFIATLAERLQQNTPPENERG